MKKIEDIFSKKNEKKEEIKTEIIIDNREKNSIIAAELIEKGAKIKFENLEIGDYIIDDIIIERKTFQDFQASIIDKRLLNQLEQMKNYEKNILLIEGFNYDYSKSFINENAFRGALLSCALSFKIPIIFTKNEEDSAKFLILIARKQDKNKKTKEKAISLRPKKIPLNLEEQKQYILEGFPGIGPTNAKNLLSSYKNLISIFKAKEKELNKILDEKTIKKMKEILEN